MTYERAMLVRSSDDWRNSSASRKEIVVGAAYPLFCTNVDDKEQSDQTEL